MMYETNNSGRTVVTRPVFRPVMSSSENNLRYKPLAEFSAKQLLRTLSYHLGNTNDSDVVFVHR